MKTKSMRMALVAIAVLIGAAALASCSTYATSTSDAHICVFDGSERGGKKLKFQVSPGAESKKIDDNDTVVKIPASNRFYTSTKNDNRRDPLAAKFYSANAKGSVPVQIEGQIRFKFNLKKACDWYSKHGRRNADSKGDLKFNARGGEAREAGWFRFLTENFGQTMDQVVRPATNRYDWAALVYDYPVNADADGSVPEGAKAGTPTDTAFGEEIGKAFSERLAKDLGGDYFCGVSEDPDDGDCPDMTFEIIRITGPTSLMETRSKLEQTRQNLANAELEGELLARQQESTIAAERAKQATLQAQLETARIQAEIDTAKCQAITKFNANLDCEGKAPAIIVGGN